MFLSGEPKLMAYHLAQEFKVNAVFAGHYATERFGVKAVGQELSRRFGVKVDFVDLDIPF